MKKLLPLLLLAGCISRPVAPPPPKSARLAEPNWIWISPAEIMALPTTGPAFDAVAAKANEAILDPSLADQDDADNTRALAKAFLCVRLGTHCDEVRAACVAVRGTEDSSGSRGLSVGRELEAYVIAAQLVGLNEDEPAFRAWLDTLRTHVLPDGRTLISTHEGRPNNWGTHAGASRMAADIYLGDETDLAAAAAVFHGWLGDETAYAGFNWGDLCWQSDPLHPAGINPLNAQLPGYGNADGAPPEEMRRGCCPTIPPCTTGYSWGGLQGAVDQMWILHRQGFPALDWEDQAVKRAVSFLYRLDLTYGNWWATGDDTWIPWLVNKAYGTSFPTTTPTTPGKNMGFTDWLFPHVATDVGPN